MPTANSKETTVRANLCQLYFASLNLGLPRFWIEAVKFGGAWVQDFLKLGESLPVVPVKTRVSLARDLTRG
jgi:hypothetical protein